MHKEADTSIWAGVGGLLGAVAVVLVINSPWRDASTVVPSMNTAVGGGALWGWLLAEARNWLGRR